MKKVIVVGPALTRTGYGEHARATLRALRDMEDKVDLYLSPTNWGNSNWVWEDSDERHWLEHLIKKTAFAMQQQVQFDVSFQVTIPNEWQKLCPVNIGVTAGIETTKVAPNWLNQSYLVDKILTISEHSKQTYINTVYEAVHPETGQPISLKFNPQVGVDVIHYSAKDYPLQDLKLNLPTKFNFLSIAQWGPRKNMHNVVSWFVEEFIDNPDAGLVLKTFAKGGSKLDRKGITDVLERMLKKYPNRQCKVYLLHGDMTEEELHSLYRQEEIKAFVSLSHGEGFGLPHFEAAYSGLPVIAPAWSGYVDFLYAPKKNKKGKEELKALFAKVDYDLSPVNAEAVWDGVIQQDSLWCYPQQGSFKMKLREVYKDYGRFKKQAAELQEWVVPNFSQEVIHARFAEAVKDFLEDEWSDGLQKIEVV